MDSRKDCFACADLDKEFSNPEFLKLAEGWKKQKLLKIGKVKCWKNEELCRGFGVAGDDDDAKGYPTLLHFKDGKQVAGPRLHLASALRGDAVPSHLTRTVRSSTGE